MNPLAFNPNINSGGSKTSSSKASMDMETFLKLLVVQLANQNPLEPMNDRDFFAQMAQLGQVQGMEKMQDSLDITQAAGLMGKTVSAVRTMTESGAGVGSLVTGKVVSLRIVDGERLLGLKEANGGVAEVNMNNIRQVMDS
jgi:flagellar basal-body rod modification protein FlgD